MKHILKIFPIILIVNIMSYSQIAGLNAIKKDPQRYVPTTFLSIIDEFSKTGELETFNAEVIRKIGKNMYWVKKAQLLDSKNEIILELGTYLYTNGTKALNQVPATNGYVIELVGSDDKWKNLLIWIADKDGEKDSDFISLEFNKNFPIVY